MYFKDNGKQGYFYGGFEIYFPYYEFSKVQHWLEVGQRLQKIFHLHRELTILLDDLDSKHGQIYTKTYDKTTGYTSGTAKPIIPLVAPDQIKYYSRMIEQCFNEDIDLITRVDLRIREFRSYNNLKENQVFFCEDNRASREKIEQHFDYIILDSLKENLFEFWDDVRKFLDDLTNKIILPKPSISNREFYPYFLQSRDCFVEGDHEIALAVMRKAVEDILTRLWILSYNNLHEIDMKNKQDLDNLPGYLKHKGTLTDQEAREVLPFIKYGNASIHVWGEIPQDKLLKEAPRMINNCISFINTLSSKYIKLMTERKYTHIDFTKVGLSVGMGNLMDYVARKESKTHFDKKYFKEFEDL
jgi:hypothetical protein